MEVSIINSKAQVIIPENIRDKYGFKSGTKVAFIEKDDNLIIQPINKKYFGELAGTLNLKGKMLKSLMDGKRREREL